MNEYTFRLDNKTDDQVTDLMTHYGVKTQAEIFEKALAALMIHAYVDSTDGELIARKGCHETKIILR